MKVYFVAGGAGFIGSNLVKAILGEDNEAKVIVYDNFSSGKRRYLDGLRSNGNLKIIKADIKNRDMLIGAMKGAQIVYHFAANPDISKAVIQPDIDFWEGTYLTNNILEAMRINNIKRILYASGSGVYGDAGLIEVEEDFPFKFPVSTYGSSKLASEALICSYCYMFDMDGVSFRFANVVGPHQTHGVGYDFVRKLLTNPKELLILGNGRQSKSYLYVTDAISAMRLLERNLPKGFSCYNIATSDYIEVRKIADIVVEIMGLKKVRYRFTGGNKGWKGDIPIVRVDSHRIRKMGWRNKYNSEESVYKSIKAMCEEIKLKQR